MASTQTALITGASTGIGAVYADRLARRGINLILVARNKEKLSQLAANLGDKYGVQVETIGADLANAMQLDQVANRLASDDKITMLVNNAGLGATAKLAESSMDQMDAMIDLNVKALTRLTLAVVPRFGKAGSGAIINIASIVAIAPEVLNGVYGGSKAYVLALTQSLNHELGGNGVRVQAVLPGAIETPFWDKAGMPVAHLPGQIVMKADDLVDAALKGFDLGEVVTIPSLPDSSEWARFDAARLAMGPNLSHSEPAGRYRA